MTDDGGAERARLRRHPDAAGERAHADEGGVERHVGGGVDHAHGVGADEAHAVAVGELDHTLLKERPRLTRLGEARADHHQAVHPLVRAVVDHGRHLVGRHAHHREVDVVGHVEDRRVGAHARHVRGVGVDRVHGSLEAAVEQPLEHVVPDGARLT